jgi:hypothetical protein
MKPSARRIERLLAKVEAELARSSTSAPVLRSQGGTVAPPGGNTCAPRSARLDLKAPVVPGPHRTIYLTGTFRAQAVQGSELTAR